MLLSVLENLVLGFAISAVPGAVFFETIRRSMLDYLSVFRFLMGNFSGMILIVIASYFGITGLFSTPIITLLFYTISGSLLIYIGVMAVLVNKEKIEHSRNNLETSNKKAYITGLSLAVANPLSIIFWVSFMGKWQSETDNNIKAVLSSGAVILGALLLFIVLIGSTRLIKNKLTISHLVLLSRTFGLIIAVYGLTTFFTAARQIWF